MKMVILQFNNTFKISLPASRQGQTLIEATVALASIMLTLAAITVAVTTSVSNSTFIRNQTIAARYAQQGMEYIRYLRNTDPTTFLGLTGFQCMNTSSPIFNPNSHCPTLNIASTYKREAEFVQNTSECGTNGSQMGTKVTVTVYFSSSRCTEANPFCHKSELISCFAQQNSVGPTL